MSSPEFGPLLIGGVAAAPGLRTNLELQVARLPTETWISMPVAVLRGRRPGPALWISAAIHGDELNGVEIVRRVLPRIPLEDLRGTVIGVPIVNVFGFLQQSRYLPDRRDLNRSFPGSARGSLAASIANLFLTEIVDRCEYGIDLHTGSSHRTNLPQIRADLKDSRTRSLVEAFRAPLSIDASIRDGSLRQVASERGCCVLLYEAGETLRFDIPAIRLGVRGILRVMKKLGMLSGGIAAKSKDVRTRIVTESRWVRAPRGGILLVEAKLGQHVRSRQTIARVSDTFGEEEREIRAPFDGLVIGSSTNPVANRGDAVVHLAKLDD